MVCLILIDFRVLRDIQGFFLTSLSLFRDTCFMGACLSTIDLSALMVQVAISCKSLY